MTRRFDHENLQVYQKAVQFCAWATPIIDGLTSKLAAKDQFDRASTSIVLNIAEGNGKRSYRDRSRYFDIARGSAVECAGCFDVLVARGKLSAETATEGKVMLIEVVSMLAGLLARFSGDGRVEEDQSDYGIGEQEKEKEKDI
jgi:four helix bundle protein